MFSKVSIVVSALSVRLQHKCATSDCRELMYTCAYNVLALVSHSTGIYVSERRAHNTWSPSNARMHVRCLSSSK